MVIFPNYANYYFLTGVLITTSIFNINIYHHVLFFMKKIILLKFNTDVSYPPFAYKV